MTRQQDKMMELLMQFHDICHKNDLTYYLIGQQLLFASKKDTIHGYEVDVAMFGKDWEILRKRSAAMKHIEIESIADGGKLPGCYFRFVDKNTLLLNLDRYEMLTKPGIGINVHIIRSCRKKTKLLSCLEKQMAQIARGKHSLCTWPYQIAKKIVGNRKWCSFLTKLERTVRAKNRESMTCLVEPYGKIIEFPEGYWKKTKQIQLQKWHFDTVENCECYLKSRYGNAWKKLKFGENFTVNLETYRCYFSSTLPYRDFLDLVEQENLLSAPFLKRLGRISNKLDYFYDKLVKEEKLGWEKTLFLAGERFRLWKKYMPIKEDVKALFAEEKYDEAELILRDYINVLEKYMKLKIVLCFDPDYLYMVSSLYRINGKSKQAKYIENHVLAEDLLPIKIEV